MQAASSKQMGVFIVSEVVLIAVLAVVVGSVVGLVLGDLLVTLLNGVFDPPPSCPVVPWGTLGLLVVLAVGGLMVAAAMAVARLRQLPVAQELRGL